MTSLLFRSATLPLRLARSAAGVLAVLVIAAPVAAEAQQAGPGARNGETRTTRSDGAVAPQVSATPRREQRRQARITSSTQALPAPDSWQTGIDPPEGGVTVAPAGTVAGDGASLPLVGVVDIPLRPAPAQSSGLQPSTPPSPVARNR